MGAYSNGYEARWQLWIPTAELPRPHPHGVHTDADGTVWVTCWDDTDGALVRIDGKTPTLVTAGLAFPRSAIESDAQGRIYYVAGGQFSATLHRYDPGTGVTTALFTDVIMGFTLSETWGLFVVNDFGARLDRRSLDGGMITDDLWADPGSGTSRRRVVALNEDESVAVVWTGNFGGGVHVAIPSGTFTNIPSGREAQAADAVPDDNGALFTDTANSAMSSTAGAVSWYDINTQAQTAISVQNDPTGAGAGFWSGINHNDDDGRVLLAHGGMARDGQNGEAVYGTDYGIVQLFVGRGGFLTGEVGFA